MTVRCFVFSFVLIKALEAHSTQIFLSNGPLRSINHTNDNTHANQTALDDTPVWVSNEDSLAMWACLFLPPLIHWLVTRQLLLHSPSVSSQVPTFLSWMGLFLSFISGVIAARISFDLNSMNSSWETFSSWYIASLGGYPMITKSVTSSVFSCVADIIAQWFEGSHTSRSFRDTYNMRRGFASSVDGMFLSGPLLHYAFGLMEEYFPTNEETGNIFASLTHVFISDIFIDSIYLGLSFALVALLEGHARDLVRIYKSDFWTTIKASSYANLSLVPIEFICFRYLSVGFRVLGMNMIDVIWQAVVSFFAHRSRREAKQTTKDPIAQLGTPFRVVSSHYPLQLSLSEKLRTEANEVDFMSMTVIQTTASVLFESNALPGLQRMLFLT
eukprot:scaffold14497_cov119-Cylindrotheca_fusiformis.AAC.2